MSTGESRRRKAPVKDQRTPMFEVRHDPLPAAPQPIHKTRDPFDAPVEIGSRSARPPTPARVPTTTAPRPMMRSEDFMLAETRPRSALAEDIADLHHADTMIARPVARPAYAGPAPSMPIPDLLRARPLVMLAICLFSIMILWWVLAPQKTNISLYNGPGSTASSPLAKAFAPQNAPAGQHSVLGAPSVSADLIDAVLSKYGSPAQGTGKIWVEMGRRYGIDPAYALAFFIHESSAGTNPGWAGMKPGGGTTHNIGNIICAGYDTCFGRFRDYPSWDAGIEDWYKLISKEYVGDRSAQTVEQIIPIYAPASDNNNVPNYVQAVVTLVESWRQGVIQ